MRLNSLFRSYSFRSAALIFLAFSLTLVAVRLTSYAQALRSAYADAHLVIEAHAEELSENIERYGPPYASTLVSSLIRDAADPDLYIGLVSTVGAVGNFPRLANAPQLPEGWSRITLQAGPEEPPLHMSVYARSYPDGTNLMIGYNLVRADRIRDSLPGMLFENIELALLLALLLSLLLVFLLNRHVRKFNVAFDKVSRGNMGYRMDVKEGGDQFDRLALNLNDMLDWLTTMLAMSRDLGNSLAHDLRTPLSRHRLELCAIAEAPDVPPAAREKLGAAVERLDELTRTLNDILTISQAEARNPAELFETVDLTAVVEDVLELYAPMLDQANQTLRQRLPRDAVRITGDSQLVSQAVLNLVDNAIKYTGEGGLIDLELSRGGAGAIVTVTDNGGGVAAEDIGRLKERFFRSDSSRGSPGSGLGLSLVDAVAKLHHGDLVVENVAGGFRATLRFGLAAGV